MKTSQIEAWTTPMREPRRKGQLPAAPPPFAEEAPSGWMARVAVSHDLTEAELVTHFGSSASELDLGYADAAMQYVAVKSAVRGWPATSHVVDSLRELGLMPPAAPRVPAQDWWSFCPRCLETGQPFLRADWCQPFAFVCLRHQAYLQAWPRGREVVLASGRVVPWWPTPGDAPHRPASDEDLEFGKRLLVTTRETWPDHARVVIDLVDAMATRSGPNGAAAPLLASLVGLERSGASSGSVRPPHMWLYHQPAQIRLKVLGKVAGLLRNPDFVAAEPPGWLRSLTHRRGASNQRQLVGATADRLMEIAAALNESALLEFGRRSEAWPSAVRQRWGAALVVAALARRA
ncbi:TniQ family protein [Brevundimonas sp.]|uniref:TniQ family protein n=1 Tax=Brevundimonas sp. TaxID=1871086 RepID=UPI002E120283